MTECSQESFAFTAHFSRRVEAAFTAGQVSTDGGSLLLREAERKINLLGRLAACFGDGRSPLLVKHPLSEMLARSAYTGWRWAAKISTTMSSCAPIHCWPCWPANGIWRSRWPAKAR